MRAPQRRQAGRTRSNVCFKDGVSKCSRADYVACRSRGGAGAHTTSLPTRFLALWASLRNSREPLQRGARRCHLSLSPASTRIARAIRFDAASCRCRVRCERPGTTDVDRAKSVVLGRCVVDAERSVPSSPGHFRSRAVARSLRDCSQRFPSTFSSCCSRTCTEQRVVE